MSLTFGEKLDVLGHTPPKYKDYADLVTRFAKKYHVMKELNLNVTMDYLTFDEIRLIYLSLMTTKAQMKEYDPKKGLNQ